MKRLKLKRTTSMILVFAFLFSFIFLGIKDTTSNTIINQTRIPEKEFYQCSDCNLIFLYINETNNNINDTEESFFMKKTIEDSFIFRNFNKTSIETIEDVFYKLKNILDDNRYIELTKNNMKEFFKEKHPEDDFYVVANTQYLENKDVDEFFKIIERQGYMKETMIIILDERTDDKSMILRLPHIQKDKVIEKEFSLDNISPTIQELLDLEKKYDIYLDQQKSLVEELTT